MPVLSWLLGRQVIVARRSSADLLPMPPRARPWQNVSSQVRTGRTATDALVRTIAALEQELPVAEESLLGFVLLDHIEHQTLRRTWFIPFSLPTNSSTA